MANDFLSFAGAGGANVLSQADYASLAARTTGFSAGVAKSQELNKVWRQSSLIASAVAQAISDITGADTVDDGTTPTIVDNIKKAMSMQGAAVVGTLCNVKMSITAASSSATITADQIIVKASLSGGSFLLPSFSKVINISTTGAGGMDTGSPPVNGHVAIYAIYNPTTGVSALLAVNATAAAAPEIYGGANMPSGYTASALVSVWPVASSQLKIGIQMNREVSLAPTVVLNTNTQQAAFASLSISSIVPLNARVARGYGQIASTSAGATVILSVAGSTSEIGRSNIVGASPAANNATGAAINDMLIIIPQFLFYIATATAGTMTAQVAITGYIF